MIVLKNRKNFMLKFIVLSFVSTFFVSCDMFAMKQNRRYGHRSGLHQEMREKRVRRWFDVRKREREIRFNIDRCPLGKNEFLKAAYFGDIEIILEHLNGNCACAFAKDSSERTPLMLAQKRLAEHPGLITSLNEQMVKAESSGDMSWYLNLLETKKIAEERVRKIQEIIRILKIYIDK